MHLESRTVVGLIIAIGLAFVAYRIVGAVHAPQTNAGRFQGGGLQAVGASTVALNNVPVVVNVGTVTPLVTVTVQSQIGGYLTKLASPKARSFIRAISWRRLIRGPSSISLSFPPLTFL